MKYKSIDSAIFEEYYDKCVRIFIEITCNNDLIRQ